MHEAPTSERCNTGIVIALRFHNSEEFLWLFLSIVAGTGIQVTMVSLVACLLCFVA